MCSNHSNKNPQEIYGVSFCGNRFLGLSFSTQHLVKVFFLSLLGEFWCDVFFLGFRAPNKKRTMTLGSGKKNKPTGKEQIKRKSTWWFQLCFCSHKHGQMIQFELRIFIKWVGGFNHQLVLFLDSLSFGGRFPMNFTAYPPPPTIRAPKALNFEAPAPEESSRGSLQLPKVPKEWWPGAVFFSEIWRGELRLCMYSIYIYIYIILTWKGDCIYI